VKKEVRDGPEKSALDALSDKRVSVLSYSSEQRRRVTKLVEEGRIFRGDTGGGLFKRKSYGFVLNDCRNNLYAPVVHDVVEYFEQNAIVWWSGKLTNHTLSSQIACLNHLFPIRDEKEAVLSLVGQICPEVVDVLLLTTDRHRPAYIQFEAVSDVDHLNERSSTRGSNCTSVDALIYGALGDGRTVLFPIEWKYAEISSGASKADGHRGRIRKARYTNLIERSAQLRADPHDEVYYLEPFYQLMRQTLWAEQMIAHKHDETVKADDYIHIHVVPAENRELLFRRRKDMEATWRSAIRTQCKYTVISPKDLFAPIGTCAQFRPLLDYLEARYW
jgi:hypothetical protein